MTNVRYLNSIETFARYARLDVYAKRIPLPDGESKYNPVEKPLSETALRRHLENEEPIGIYLIERGSDKTRLAAFDLDDHDGDMPWEVMREIGLRIAKTAAQYGLNAWPVRSGGGHGIHLFYHWDKPQLAADVRSLLTTILAGEGFSPGVGGVTNSQIEIFPKQDRVTDDGFGSLIAVPFARQSVPLDAGLMPTETGMGWISSQPVARSRPEEAIDQNLPADQDAIVTALNFIDNSALDYEAWINIGLVLKTALGDAGKQLFVDFSKQYKGNTDRVIEKKWHSFKTVTLGVGYIYSLARHAGWKGLPNEAPPFSDIWLALKFVDEHGSQLRYTAKWSRWNRWNGVYWQPDDTLIAMDVSRDFCRKVAMVANKKRGSLASAKVVGAVMSLSRADRRIAATIDQWDQNDWLLGTPGGTVDLRSGELRKSQQTEYITRNTNVTPGGDWTRWKRFLNDIAGGDQELIDYLQRLAGYCLTGSVREHALIFFHGSGRNGKTTFIETLRKVMGDYSQTVAMTTLLMVKHQEHPTEVAKLLGARLAIASETSDGARWNTSRVKMLTGGDGITARYMRGDFFDFRPTHKLVVLSNKKPAISSIDEAIKERIHMVPFRVTFTHGSDREPDPTLPEKLMQDAGGVLAWAIEGCLAWQRIGLCPPRIILDATAEYLESQDTLQNWLDECCVLDVNARMSIGELYESWKKWAEGGGTWIGNKNDFSQRLSSKGLSSSKSKGTNYFKGIRVANQTDTKEDERDIPF